MRTESPSPTDLLHGLIHRHPPSLHELEQGHALSLGHVHEISRSDGRVIKGYAVLGAATVDVSDRRATITNRTMLLVRWRVAAEI